MEILSTLNRRHKAVLFLTLLSMGLALSLFRATLAQTLGVGLIGIALAWAIGSDSRVMHSLWVLLGVGFLLLAGANGWEDYEKERDTYHTQLVEGLLRPLSENTQGEKVGRKLQRMVQPHFSIVNSFRKRPGLPILAVVFISLGIVLLTVVKPRKAPNQPAEGNTNVAGGAKE